MHSDEMMTKYYGYLNLICYELELYKKNENQTINDYQNLSESIDTSTVKFYNGIIIDWKKKLGILG